MTGIARLRLKNCESLCHLRISGNHWHCRTAGGHVGYKRLLHEPLHVRILLPHLRRDSRILCIVVVTCNSEGGINEDESEKCAYDNRPTPGAPLRAAIKKRDG